MYYKKMMNMWCMVVCIYNSYCLVFVYSNFM